MKNILRNGIATNFTMVQNTFIFDFDLSLKSKSIFLVLLALPDSWDFSAKGLAILMKVSVNTINSGLVELEKSGYLERKIIRESGKILGCDYILKYPERKVEQEQEETVCESKEIKAE